MLRSLTQSARLDRLAIGLSGLCLIHCILSAAALAVLASVGGILGADWIHEVGLGLAMALGALALGRGAYVHRDPVPLGVGLTGLVVMGFALTLPHDGSEALVTMGGVALLALGHRLNHIGA